MGNWLSTEPGLSSVDTVHIPSGQRDDNCHGGEETEGKGRNQAVVSYTTNRIGLLVYIVDKILTSLSQLF